MATLLYDLALHGCLRGVRGKTKVSLQVGIHD